MKIFGVENSYVHLSSGLKVQIQLAKYDLSLKSHFAIWSHSLLL